MKKHFDDLIKNNGHNINKPIIPVTKTNKPIDFEKCYWCDCVLDDKSIIGRQGKQDYPFCSYKHLIEYEDYYIGMK